MTSRAYIDIQMADIEDVVFLPEVHQARTQLATDTILVHRQPEVLEALGRKMIEDAATWRQLIRINGGR